MKIMISWKVGFIRVALSSVLISFVLNGFALASSERCYLGAYKGWVVGRDSGKPIEGVIIHAEYGVCSVTSSFGAAAILAEIVAVRETLTDSNGEFIIPEGYVRYECPGGKLSGRLQIFKPGYGISTRRFSVKNDNKKEYFCDIEFGKYIVYELQKLKTRMGREATLSRISPARNVPDDQQKLLLSAINKERTTLAQDKGRVPLPSALKRPKKRLTQSPLLLAVKNNLTDKAMLLIKDGADVNQKDETGLTPLMYASRFNNTTLVKRLIDKGAEINTASDMGRTPLIEAVINNQKEAVDILIASGAALKPFPYSGKKRLNTDGRIVEEEIYGKRHERRVLAGGASRP